MQEIELFVLSAQGKPMKIRRFFKHSDEIASFLACHGYRLIRKKGVVYAKTQRMDRETVLRLFQYLAQCGALPLDQALLACLDWLPDKRSVILGLYNRFQKGLPLYQCFSHYSKCFDPMVLQILKTSPESPVVTFSLIVEHLTYCQERQKNIRQAFGYPAIVLSFMLLFFVLFCEMIAPELPINNPRWLYPWIGCVVGFTASVLILLFGVPSCKNRFIIFLPLYGKLYRLFLEATYTRMLVLLLRARIPLPQALEALCETVENHALRDQYQNWWKRLKEGRVTPEEFSPSRLEQKANLLWYQLEEKSRRMLRWVEPVVLLVAGLLLLWIVATLWLPMYAHF